MWAPVSRSRHSHVSSGGETEQQQPRTTRTARDTMRRAGEREHRERRRDHQGTRKEHFGVEAIDEIAQHALLSEGVIVEHVAGRVVAVVCEDRLVEVREVPASSEIGPDAEPDGCAYSTDHQNVGEGAAARVPRPRRDEVSGRQQGARGGRDGLVERGEREEPPYREDAPDAGLTAGSDK